MKSQSSTLLEIFRQVCHACISCSHSMCCSPIEDRLVHICPELLVGCSDKWKANCVNCQFMGWKDQLIHQKTKFKTWMTKNKANSLHFLSLCYFSLYCSPKASNYTVKEVNTLSKETRIESETVLPLLPKSSKWMELKFEKVSCFGTQHPKNSRWIMFPGTPFQKPLQVLL